MSDPTKPDGPKADAAKPDVTNTNPQNLDVTAADPTDANQSGGSAASSAKVEANRRNAQQSTGPKSEAGKASSRQNAVKHGMLAAVVLHRKGAGAEDDMEFNQLLNDLRRDIEPIGPVEDLLVQEIAACHWRERRAYQFEAGVMQRQFSGDRLFLDKLSVLPPTPAGGIEDYLNSNEDTDHLRLPAANDLNRLVRYQSANQRQLATAYNRLERRQRARKGEHVPAPLAVQVTNAE